MAKEHLDFDLEFLDSDNPEGSKARPSYHKETFPSRRESSTSAKPKHAINRLWWWWANKTGKEKRNLVIGVVAAFVILGSVIVAASTPDTSVVSSSTGTTPTTPIIPPANTSQNTFPITDENGKTFYCSSSDHDRAQGLKPSDYEKSAIETDQATVLSKENELENLQSDIDSMYVNDYSPQYLIDEYNDMVDDYNGKHAVYKRLHDNLDNRIDAYNQRVDTYNNFLRTNCSPT